MRISTRCFVSIYLYKKNYVVTQCILGIHSIIEIINYVSLHPFRANNLFPKSGLCSLGQSYCPHTALSTCWCDGTFHPSNFITCSLKLLPIFMRNLNIYNNICSFVIFVIDLLVQVHYLLIHVLKKSRLYIQCLLQDMPILESRICFLKTLLMGVQICRKLVLYVDPVDVK